MANLSAFDAMRACQKGDPLYDLLPPMFYDPEKKKYYIYTMVKTPLKEHIEMMKNPDPRHEGERIPVKVQDSLPKLHIYLVFDWRNQIKEECLTEGKIYLSKADSLACVSMEYESRSTVDVLYYMDLSHNFDDYRITDAMNIEGVAGRGTQRIVEQQGLISYESALSVGKIPEGVQFALSQTNLIGGYRQEDVVSYEDDAQYGRNVRQVRTQQVHHDGILSNIALQHVYIMK